MRQCGSPIRRSFTMCAWSENSSPCVCVCGRLAKNQPPGNMTTKDYREKRIASDAGHVHVMLDSLRYLLPFPIPSPWCGVWDGVGMECLMTLQVPFQLKTNQTPEDRAGNSGNDIGMTSG